MGDDGRDSREGASYTALLKWEHSDSQLPSHASGGYAAMGSLGIRTLPPSPM